MKINRILFFWFAVGWIACSNSEKQADTVPANEPTSETEQNPEDLPGANSDGAGEADLRPVEDRDARRLSIRALSVSLTQTTGVEWLVDDTSPFKTFRTSLGIPDYAQSVSEDLDPGIMFYKLLINAATYSCEAMVTQDLELPIEQRKLLNNISEDSTDPTEVKTALVKALVRFHGEEEDLAHDSALLMKWYTLWEGLQQSHGSDDTGMVDQQNANLMAWQLVCEALILSPNFYTY